MGSSQNWLKRFYSKSTKHIQYLKHTGCSIDIDGIKFAVWNVLTESVFSLDHTLY